MKITIISLVVWLAGTLALPAQNYAVRFLSQDTNHEFNVTAGCPTNWPVAVDHIGTNSLSPWPNRAVLDRPTLQSLYATAGPAFTNWYQNTYRPFVAQREANDYSVRTNNMAQLKALYADMATYEQRWQTNLPATNNAQINAVLRTQNSFLLQLRPVLQELYRGD